MITYLVVGISILIIINFIMLCYLAWFIDKVSDVDFSDLYYKARRGYSDIAKIESKVFAISQGAYTHTSKYVVDELPGMFDKVDTVSISTGKYLELIQKEKTLKDLEYKLNNGN